MSTYDGRGPGPRSPGRSSRMLPAVRRHEQVLGLTVGRCPHPVVSGDMIARYSECPECGGVPAPTFVDWRDSINGDG